MIVQCLLTKNECSFYTYHQIQCSHRKETQEKLSWCWILPYVTKPTVRNVNIFEETPRVPAIFVFFHPRGNKFFGKFQNSESWRAQRTIHWRPYEFHLDTRRSKHSLQNVFEVWNFDNLIFRNSWKCWYFELKVARASWLGNVHIVLII